MPSPARARAPRTLIRRRRGRPGDRLGAEPPVDHARSSRDVDGLARCPSSPPSRQSSRSRRSRRPPRPMTGSRAVRRRAATGSPRRRRTVEVGHADVDEDQPVRRAVAQRVERLLARRRRPRAGTPIRASWRMRRSAARRRCGRPRARCGRQASAWRGLDDDGSRSRRTTGSGRRSWNRKVDPRPTVLSTCEPAAHEPDEPVGDGEPEAGALLAALRLHERVEDVGEPVRRDARGRCRAPRSSSATVRRAATGRPCTPEDRARAR